jgi:hypothetical protein
MDGWLLATIILVGLGAVLSLIVTIAQDSQTASLKKRFRRLGTIAGRTRKEIVEVVGPPSGVSSLPEGKVLLQWMGSGAAGAYHIALVFANQGEHAVCEGINHEVSL